MAEWFKAPVLKFCFGHPGPSQQVPEEPAAQALPHTSGRRVLRSIGEWWEVGDHFGDQQAAWRAEFKRIHDTEAFHSGSDDPKTAFRWSGDEAKAQRLQEEHTHHYLRSSLALSLL